MLSVQGRAEIVALSLVTALRIPHENAFGQFELEIARFPASILQDAAHAFEKVLGPELYRGDVDRHWDRPQAGIHPGSGLSACFVQDPPADRHDEATVFSDAHEPRWRDEPSIWVYPA
jgi:hypothetical protein